MNRIIYKFLLLTLLTIGALKAADMSLSQPARPPADAAGQEGSLSTAVFAGGCFWCVEADLEKLEGVKEVISGYTGGRKSVASYKQVSAGNTGHLEAVEVHFDAVQISYSQLLDTFFRHIDPTDGKGQFVDRGTQYRPAIFYRDEVQKMMAQQSLDLLAASGRFEQALVVEIIPATVFYPAEAYHQDYYKKNPVRYRYYRYRSGRDQFLDKVWSQQSSAEPDVVTAPGVYHKPKDEVLRSKLSPLQYQVTQEENTELPFENEYWDNDRPGIYVDIVSGEPLFSSRDKFKSGTGWPSFSKPLAAEHIVEKVDYKLIFRRVEVRSKYANSHLGHLFTDGPTATGLRYCINSAALKFIPKDRLVGQGYQQFSGLFLTELNN